MYNQYFKKRSISKKKGFTILEMLIVVALMAILSAVIIVPNLQALKTVRRRTDEENAKIIQLAFEQYYYDNNKFPTGTPTDLSGQVLSATADPVKTLIDNKYLDPLPEVQSTTNSGTSTTKENWYVRNADLNSGKVEIFLDK